VIAPGIYRHYKGGLYRVLFEAHDSTNGPHEGRSLVVYVSLTTGRINVRASDQFVDSVGVVGYAATPRFALVEEEKRS
jgi:hypothetical protein